MSDKLFTNKMYIGAIISIAAKAAMGTIAPIIKNIIKWYITNHCHRFAGHCLPSVKAKHKAWYKRFMKKISHCISSITIFRDYLKNIIIIKVNKMQIIDQLEMETG